jgi:hypothetical protein
MTQLPSSHTIYCRILYATQSGRAKACARRTARIIADQTPPPQQQRPKSSKNETEEPPPPPLIVIQNGQGSTFNDDIAGTVRMEEYVQGLQRSRTTLLILFVSTTGDGEHTVRGDWYIYTFIYLYF